MSEKLSLKDVIAVLIPIQPQVSSWSADTHFAAATLRVQFYRRCRYDGMVPVRDTDHLDLGLELSGLEVALYISSTYGVESRFDVDRVVYHPQTGCDLNWLRVARMHKTLSLIDRALTRRAAKEAVARSFGQLVLRVCEALKVQHFALRRPDRAVGQWDEREAARFLDEVDWAVQDAKRCCDALIQKPQEVKSDG